MSLRNEVVHLAQLLTAQFSDYAGAKAHYKKAIEINPDYANAHYNLAFLLKHQFLEYAHAKSFYLKAIRLNPRLKTDKADIFFKIDNNQP